LPNWKIQRISFPSPQPYLPFLAPLAHHPFLSNGSAANLPENGAAEIRHNAGAKRDERSFSHWAPESGYGFDLFSHWLR
jgi:hypothetical protein